MRLESNYMNCELLINRIKTDGEDTFIHVNKQDGKRVNFWVKLTDNMCLFNSEGYIVSWASIRDGGYYRIKFTEEAGRIRCDILSTVFAVFSFA